MYNWITCIFTQNSEKYIQEKSDIRPEMETQRYSALRVNRIVKQEKQNQGCLFMVLWIISMLCIVVITSFVMKNL